jgi:hypothetical protein
MISPEQLANGYALNTRIIQLQTDELTHADSLIQAPYNINSFNWVLGHIVVNRDRVLALLGENPYLTETETARYRRESQPIREDGEGVIPLERLLEIINKGQTDISKALGKLEPHALEAQVQLDGDEKSLGDRLFGLYFHDTYHTGQTDLLRQVSGKNDKII